MKKPDQDPRIGKGVSIHKEISSVDYWKTRFPEELQTGTFVEL